MNIVMPMAGKGQRFKDAGYDVPKPFIDVHGATMYRRALSPFVTDMDQVILVTQDDHQPHFEAEPDYVHQSKKVFLQGPTEGAACSVLAARAFIDNEEPLLIVNCDQIIRYNRFNWAVMANMPTVDGIIFTFPGTGPKWSYVRLDDTLKVSQVAEKVEISPFATCGAYWFRRGDIFCAAADTMIEKDIRTNGEFYLAPVYNEVLTGFNLNILPFMADQMISLGTPELLKDYLSVRRLVT